MNLVVKFAYGKVEGECYTEPQLRRIGCGSFGSKLAKTVTGAICREEGYSKGVRRGEGKRCVDTHNECVSSAKQDFIVMTTTTAVQREREWRERENACAGDSETHRRYIYV